MYSRLFMALPLAILITGTLSAQVTAPPLWLWIDGSYALPGGDVAVICGSQITLRAGFNGSISDYALLVSPCGAGASMDWQILAQGAAPPDGVLSASGSVPDTMSGCSFMLAIAGTDGSGWWYLSPALTVRVLDSPPPDADVIAAEG